jgi:transcription elongation factor Elf1
MSDPLPCPRCGRETHRQYTATNQGMRTYFYKCKSDACRNHFRVVKIEGLPLQVINQSPLERKGVNNPVIGLMGCPGCGAHGKVKTSYKRDDGYWRRHQCLTCGPYFTCEHEGRITIHKKLKSLLAIDNN